MLCDTTGVCDWLLTRRTATGKSSGQGSTSGHDGVKDRFSGLESTFSKFGQQVGLQISKRKTEVMTGNVNAPAPVLLDDQALPSTETFTCLGSVVRQDGGTKEDIQNRLSKARNAFRSLNAVRRSSQYSVKTKLKLYQSCVLSTLLYGSEC